MSNLRHGMSVRKALLRCVEIAEDVISGQRAGGGH